MTVRELKKMLRGVDDDLLVMIYQPSEIGGFLFAEACSGESGKIELGPPDEDTGEVGNMTECFALMPHGVTAEDDGDGEEVIPELN